MSRKILIIDGHPDPSDGRLCHSLADAYADGAYGAEHEVKWLKVAELDFPLLRSKSEFNEGPVPITLKDAQEKILWANHILIVYPLWLGTMPALLKGFLEQVMRPNFAFEPTSKTWFGQRLGGRSARIIVTMGMPALLYRLFFRSHSLKSLERNILKFSGISPVRHTILGMVENASLETRQKWLRQLTDLGARAV